MKKSIHAIILIACMALITPATAQEREGCFFIDSKGQLMDLGDLCPDNREEVIPDALAEGGVFEVPIKRREGGVAVVDVTFNDNKTYEMLFDTGASGILITSKTAQELGVRVFDTATSVIASGEEMEVGIGTVSSVKVGNLTLGETPVAIAPATADEGLKGMGLLGQTVYGDYDVTIKENVIEFKPRS
ncbi:MAG TPA: retroviral-like aspartic protease family protein [Oscillatoriaceae cyanobacterium M33_DOE_052]|uniref:Aspartyl protease n=1 Tax=Planktothricoides sp. SpSt-374 TaxID=2282167 RepID=A0A7C3VJI7_9CYAN|nr:retroviral-like aspartic protease family protein [Oscillatoriaceae cyanobacterium M33_DOE_052]